MNTSLVDISTVDPVTVSLFRDFTAAVGEISWLMIGATARDIFLHHIHGRPIQRATKDIDLGVQLASWEAYEELKTRLLDSKQFMASLVQHRLVHKGGLPLDLIPFGDLATNQRIRWPSGLSGTEMNVIGYDDALKGAVMIKIASNPDLIIPIASLAGITILKIQAWSDYPEERAKDVIDLGHIFSEYLDLGNWDRLTNEDVDITESDTFTARAAGAELLGRDVRKICSPETLRSITTVFTKELELGELSKMVQTMSKTLPRNSSNDRMEFLQAFMRGLQWVKA